MAKRRIYFALPLIAALLATIGCSTPSTPEPVVVSTVDASRLAPAPQGACGNRLFPVIVGATWTYTVSGAATSETIVRSITALDGNAFTIQDAFLSGSSKSAEWSCDGGALSSASSGLGGAFISGQPDMVYRIVSVTGVTLPATINSGDSWTQNTSLEGTGLVTGQPVDSTGNVSFSCSARETEQVSVPAGAFDAVPVDCTSTADMIFTSGNTPYPIVQSSTSTYWYAADAGLVKLDSDVPDVGQSTLELVTFSFP